jgi:uncharacterized membrane protein (UPF0127 family)
MEKLEVFFRRKKIVIEVKRLSSLGKYKGLMLCSKNCKNLLFNFKKPARYAIHSFFVFFAFLAIWLDEKNNVVDKKIIYPFTSIVKPKKNFVKLVEVPINDKTKNIISFFVGKERFKYKI